MSRQARRSRLRPKRRRRFDTRRSGSWLDDDPEQGAAARARAEADRAAMGEHDLTGQAEADAGALGLGREERQEHVLAQRLRYAGAVVGDLDAGAAAADEGEAHR